VEEILVAQAFFKKILLIILLPLFLCHKAFAGFASTSMWASIALPVIAGGYSLYIDDYQGARQLIYSELVAGQVTALLKATVNRTTPDGTSDSSFPCAEASVGFAASSYVQHRYGLLASVPFYVATSAISLERINVKKEYWSDVLFGAALGYVSAAFFTTPYISVTPECGTKYCGVRFKWILP
jgi:membrane-associated phospholipid phosphatase